MSEHDSLPSVKPLMVLRDISSWLTAVTNKTWSWVRNSRCKYVTLSIDTRSGAYSIWDRDNLPITAAELWHQTRSESMELVSGTQEVSINEAVDIVLADRTLATVIVKQLFTMEAQLEKEDDYHTRYGLRTWGELTLILDDIRSRKN